MTTHHLWDESLSFFFSLYAQHMRVRTRCLISGVPVCVHVFKFAIESALFTGICGWPCTASCTIPLFRSLAHPPTHLLTTAATTTITTTTPVNNLDDAGC